MPSNVVFVYSIFGKIPFINVIYLCRICEKTEPSVINLARILKQKNAF